MPEVLTGLALVGFVVAWTGGVAAWFAILIYGVKAVRRSRPGVNLWGRDTWWNPAYVLIRPSLLTEEGRGYQRKCFLALGVFVICVGVPLAIAALTGNPD